MAPLTTQLEALRQQMEALRMQFEALRLEIEALKSRMERYDKELDTSNALLARLEERLLSLVSIGKWILGVVTTVGVSVLIAYLTANFLR